jgi:tRNA pseudouridine55 synthase
MRKVGHGGTLDPMATGLLPVLLGEGTKISAYVLGANKTYQGQAQLGVETDTFDREGEIIRQTEVGAIPDSRIFDAMKQFVGDISQIPPKYSAIKISGKPAHRLMRQGKDVELAARTVTVREFRLLDRSGDHFSFEVTCGSGTYIRSLVHDLGQVLGTGAILTALHRTRTGSFDISKAVDITDVSSEELSAQILPIREGFSDNARVVISDPEIQSVRHGQINRLNPVRQSIGEGEKGVLVESDSGEPVAIASPENETLVVRRVFQSARKY